MSNNQRYGSMVSFRITDEMRRKLFDYSDACGISSAEIARWALGSLLKMRPDERKLPSMLQEDLAQIFSEKRK